ncbi:hypothetical protein Y032_0179g726 [Ancylostoma ceylanicum]|uniref:Uncharacterized protein n=1 Tax=Ancylostoma ceylanicum TaxID=53326 RepID=A0A016STN7_9BILA|nr:hypothetical protein Y032_0179g726 [Ancylostoma ceylanicum]
MRNMVVGLLALLFAAAIVHAGKVEPAVELLNVPNIKQMLCLYDNKYKVVLLKAYDNNRFIGTAVTNAWRARMSQMNYEVYMVPDPSNKKSALQQVGELVFGLSNEGLAEFRRIWIRVTDPKKWSTSTGSNRRFLERLFDAARTHTREIGIITNKDDFIQITGGVSLGRSDVRLWYLEDGCDKKKADLEYFAPFGDWNAMDARQYCAAAQVCGLTVNKSVVSPWSFPIRK